MNVSELARDVGIAPSAVRFYERSGILPAARRRANGYREYDDIDLCRLRVVTSLRRLGLELAPAGRLAELCASGQCDAMGRDLAPLVAAQRLEIDGRRRELDELDAQLAVLESALEGACASTELCLDGTAPGLAPTEHLRKEVTSWSYATAGRNARARPGRARPAAVAER